MLVHTSAGPEWSNLALSGLYVDMLRRIVAVSAGVAAAPSGQLLAPRRALAERWGRMPAGTNVVPFPVAA